MPVNSESRINCEWTANRSGLQTALQTAQWRDYRPKKYFALQKNVVVARRTTTTFLEPNPDLC
jgi:hypothetical protein